jgi:hypothetical protein
LRRLKSRNLLKNNSNGDLTLLIEEGKQFVKWQAVSNASSQNLKGHESEQEEQG